jgi:DNA processing protein
MPEVSPFELSAAIEFSRCPGVGAATFRRWIDREGSPSSAFRAYTRAPGIPRAKSRLEDGQRATENFIKQGGTVLYYGHSSYPHSLCALSEPPPLLFVKGDLNALHQNLIAIVGARRVDGWGIQEAKWVSERCIQAGFGIVSGGARGIDATSHDHSLHHGATNVAVLGTGADVVYPAEHESLFSTIAHQGALVSELFPTTKPIPSFFLTRNRLIAGLACAVIVIRSQEKSGALTTARWANKLGKAVAVLKTVDDAPSGPAAQILANRGANLVTPDRSMHTWLRAIPRLHAVNVRQTRYTQPFDLTNDFVSSWESSLQSRMKMLQSLP